MSIATWQLSFTTFGASSLFIHSRRWGRTSGVAMPPKASAASCLTMSDSELSWRTLSSAGTECGERSWPNMKAISCLCSKSIRWGNKWSGVYTWRARCRLWNQMPRRQLLLSCQCCEGRTLRDNGRREEGKCQRDAPEDFLWIVEIYFRLCEGREAGQMWRGLGRQR